MSRIAPLLLGTLAAAAVVAAVLAPDPPPVPKPPTPPTPEVAAPTAPVAAKVPAPEVIPETVLEEEPPVIIESRPSPWGEGEVPPKNRGSGSASMDLTLVDRATGRPVEASVRLWRLDVPEDDDWSAGDHVQARADVGGAGAVIADLPEGRYRIQCDDQRRGAEDPPEFPVERATERSFHLDMPRKFHARLAVFDDWGRPVERGLLVGGIGSSYSHGTKVPDWASPRRLKEGFTNRWIGLGAG